MTSSFNKLTGCLLSHQCSRLSELGHLTMPVLHYNSSAAGRNVLVCLPMLSCEYCIYTSCR